MLVVLVIGYMVWNGSTGTSTTGGTATTTQQTGNTDTATTPPVPAQSAGLPGVQTGRLAVPADTSAVVTGYVAPNGALTTYWFDFGTSGSLTNRTTPKTVGAGFVTVATPAFLSGLTPNTTYSYRMSAQNSFGSVEGNTYTFTTTANPPPVGKAPTVSTNAATAIDRTNATLNGHVNPNNAQTTYWFEYGTTPNFGSVSSFGVAGSGTDSLPIAVPVGTLSPQTKYYYRFNAQNNYGTVSGATQSFTTAGPATTGLPMVDTTAATLVGTSTATLNARINPHNAASSYWFEYGTTPLLTNILGTVTATQTLPGEATTNVSVTANGLSNNTTYYYRGVARNPQGTVAGDIVSFTTKR